MTRSTSPPQTYDEDFFTWTQEQAAALRRSADRLPDDVDVEHCAEEIEDLGKRDLREVGSLLELLLVHLMKIDANPASPGVPHWRTEARAFSRSARKAFSPGMRRLIEVSEVWAASAASLAGDAKDLGLQPPRARPCPFDLDDLLSPAFDVDLALARMAAAGHRT